jgi:type IV secretion system protein TrbG
VIEGTGSKYPLVHLTASQPGMTTGLTIPTSKRLYLVDARSVGSSKVRVVRWTYPAEPAKVVSKPQLLPDPSVPAMYHGGYTMEPAEGRPAWKPLTAVDDGRRTYVIFPRNLSVQAAPLARLIGANGPELINPVLVEHVLVLEHLVPYALELRMGSGETAEVVKIVRGPATRIACHGDPQCPVWPQAGASVPFR